MKTSIIAGGLLLTLAQPLAAASVSIFPGDNWQTVTATYPPGTSYIVEPGVHWRQRVQPETGDSFIGQDGAVMHGGRVLTSFAKEGGLWTAAVRSMWGSDGSPHGSCDSALTNADGSRYTGCRYNEMLYFDREPLLRVVTKGEVGPGTWYFDYGADRIYFADDPTARTVEISLERDAFRGPADDVTIENLTIEMYATRAQGGAIHGKATKGWVVRNNTVQYNHGGGLRTGASWLVEGNRFLRNGQLGLGGSRSHGTEIIGNEIAHNNTAHFSVGWEAGGTKWTRAQGLLIQDNHSHDNIGPGLWTDIDNINVVYDGNLVENNTEEGIFHEISCNAIIRNNVVKNNGTGGPKWYYRAGIFISTSYNVDVHNNYVEVEDNDTANGITMVQQNRTMDAQNCASRMHASNNLVHGNSVYFLGDSGRVGGSADYEDEAFLEAGNFFDNNAYCATNLDSKRWGWEGTRTWTEWRSIGFDQQGVAYRLADPQCATMRAERLKELARENARLRKAVADLTLDKMILKEAAEGNF